MQEKQLSRQENSTIRLFDADGYLSCFQAKVVSCVPDGEGGWYSALDRTAFFPEGGGQSADSGFLNETKVTAAVEKDGVIYHRTNAPLEAGAAVRGQIDFEERFDKMQQHTGEHILSGIANRLYGCQNVGFHLGGETTVLDFDVELSAEQVQTLERKANEAVFKNLPVNIRFPEKEALQEMEYRSKIEIEGQVRLVEIPGVDVCACCAPHVRRTGEVGLIKALSCERHRGGCRLTIACGKRALKDYQKKQEITGRISEALSANTEKIPEALARFTQQQQKLRGQLNRVQALYLQEKLRGISKNDDCVFIFEEELETIAVRNFVNAAMERCDGICGAFVGNDRQGYHYILGSRTKDVREAAAILNQRFSGKGGGKPQMVQGSLFGSEEAVREALREIWDCGNCIS